jgi:transposase
MLEVDPGWSTSACRHAASSRSNRRPRCGNRQIDREVEVGIAPSAVEQVSTDPGGKNVNVRAIISEIGIDMSRFATVAHLISWACICPRNDESAGNRRSTRIRKGSP